MIRKALLVAALLLPFFAAPAFAAGEAAYEKGETYFREGSDYPKAKEWFLKAAKEGNGLAQLRLGFLSAEGHFAGLTPDLAAAEQWFLKAAEQNAGDARFRLGNFYANYKNPRDYKKAFYWLKRAAEGRNRTAMFDLAMLYKEGKGTPPEPLLAVSWLERAARAGVPQAYDALVVIYKKGDGVPANSLLALKWTMKAAARPDAPVNALNRAGDLLFAGDGDRIPKNYPAARKYYQHAADHGDAHAAARLKEIDALLAAHKTGREAAPAEPQFSLP